MKLSRLTRSLLTVGLLAGSSVPALADYYQYTYVGNPIEQIETSSVDPSYIGGRVTAAFRATSLLSSGGTFQLLTDPAISHVVVNFDKLPFGDPRVDTTFGAYPGAELMPWFSYVKIGSDPHTIVQWEIAKTFRPIVSPHPGVVVTTGYEPGVDWFKSFCVIDCSAFDRVALDGQGGWVYNKPGEWTVVLVPEPSTYALMAAGLAMVGWVGRRRGAKG